MRLQFLALALPVLLLGACGEPDPPAEKPKPADVPPADDGADPKSTTPAGPRARTPSEVVVAELVGPAQLARGGDYQPIGREERLKRRDALRLPAGSSITLEYSDDSMLLVTGPAEFAIGPTGEEGYQVSLFSGTISRAESRTRALRIWTPYDALLDLRGALGDARIEPGDKVVFRKHDGDVARVVSAGKKIALGEAEWIGAASDTAFVVTRVGGVTRLRDAQTEDVAADTRLAAGDVLQFADDQATAKLRFTDGTTLDLQGPGELTLLSLGAAGRRVRLGAGRILRARAGGAALEIQTHPKGASLVLQNATGAAVIEPTGAVRFDRIEGDYAKVWHAGEFHDLGDEPWTSGPPDEK